MMLRGLMIIALSLLAGCVSVPATRYYGGDGDYYYGAGSAAVVIDSYGYGGGFGYGGYGSGYGAGWGYGGGYYAPWYGGWGYGPGYSPYPHSSQQSSPRRVDPGLRGRHGERSQAAPQRYDGRRPAAYPGADDRQRLQRVNPGARPSGVQRAPPVRSAAPDRLMPRDYRGGGRDGQASGRPQYNPAAGMRNAPPNRASAPQRVAPSRASPARPASSGSE